MMARIGRWTGKEIASTEQVRDHRLKINLLAARRKVPTPLCFNFNTISPLKSAFIFQMLFQHLSHYILMATV